MKRYRIAASGCAGVRNHSVLEYSRAANKFAAQVSQPAVSRRFQPADAANSNTRGDSTRAADFGRVLIWKSVIQQVWRPVWKPALLSRCWPLGLSERLCEEPCEHPRRAFTLIELLVVLAITAILAGLLLPALSRSKAKAYNAACVNNLRQLGIATRLYSEDNEERLPSGEILPTQPIDPQNRLPRICDVLARYTGRTGGTNTSSAAVFKCPADKKGRFAAEGSSYEWNTDLNGRRIDETRTDSAFLLLKRGDPSGGVTNFFMTYPPGMTPLLLDYDEVHLRPPNSGKNVVFMDGHVAPMEVPRAGSE